MSYLPGTEDALWYAGLLLKALLLWRLFSLGLAPRYRALVICIAVNLGRSLVLLPMGRRTTAYGVTYALTLPIQLASFVLAALEIYGLVLKSYRGLSILSRGVMLAALGVSAVLAVAAVWPQVDFTSEPYRVLRMVMLLESSVCNMLLLFMLALCLFLLWYPVPLRKNVLLYSFGAFLFFISMAAVSYLRNANPTAYTPLVSTARLAVYDITFLLWLVLFSRRWENEIGAGAVRFTQHQQEKLLAQLEAMNRVLESGRR